MPQHAAVKGSALHQHTVMRAAPTAYSLAVVMHSIHVYNTTLTEVMRSIHVYNATLTKV